MGMSEGTTIFESLKSWLGHKPSPKAVAAWKELCKGRAKISISKRCGISKPGCSIALKKIAAAAGVSWSRGQISPAERTCPLNDLASAFLGSCVRQNAANNSCVRQDAAR